jgi:large subunit ribosomal protein L23
MSLFDRIRGTSSAPQAGKAKTKAIPKKTTSKKAEKIEAASSVPVSSGPVKRPELFSLLQGPHLSEKAARSSEKGVYVFNVALKAEKIAIKKAVEAMYNVQVVSVRTVRLQGKPVYRGRRPGARSAHKKAVVTLKPGQTINLYEGA